MNTSNLKDRLTTIAGLILALSGTELLIEQNGIVVPSSISITCKALGIISGSVIAFLTGKNPDGSTKTPEQVAAQNPKV